VHSPDIGKLILRVSVALLLLLHGIGKMTHGVAWIQGLLASKGLPEFIAFGVFFGEVLGPLMMIAGWRTRIGAALVAFNMLMAVLLAQSGAIFAVNQHGAWKIELPMLFCFGALAVVFLGAGKYSLSKGQGRWD
jgi:putative oxidoreductase